MLTALLFPGQGSQRLGMLASLPDHPAVTATREEAAALLDRDWRELDGADALARTDDTQIALTVAGVAAARALAALGAKIDLVAGHSVGAFPAAVVAGALGFADALTLVRLRGGLMAKAHPAGFGMTAILGLRENKVAALVETAREDGPLYVSNRNAELQTVVSGADAALERIAALALAAGARKAERLNVATPSHCPLVADVADRLRDAMANLPARKPALAYLSARRARVLRDAAAIAEDLARNVAEPVLWRDSGRLMRELGVGAAVVVPPGAILRDLTAEALGEGRLVAMDDVGLSAAYALLRQSAG